MPTFRVGKPRAKTNLAAPVLSDAGTLYPIEWSGVDFDEPTSWSIGTPSELPIGKTGLWLIGLELTATALVTDFLNIQLLINGSYGPTDSSDAPADQLIYLGLTSLWELQAGDILTAAAYSGAGEDFYTYPGSAMWCTRVGPERWTG